MTWNPLARMSKILVAVAAVALGVWVLANERYGALVTDAVTNAPLVELKAPADGAVSVVVEEGDFVSVGQELAIFTAVAPVPARFLQEARGGALQPRTPVSRERAAEETLLAEVTGFLWDSRTPKNARHGAGETVADVADCSRLFVVAKASEARARDVKVGDPATFVAADLQLNGTVQRLVAGVPNLSSRHAVQLPTSDPDTYLIFVALDVPVETAEHCAIGLRGRIDFQRNSTGSFDRLRAFTTKLGEDVVEKVRDLAKAHVVGTFGEARTS
jgi:hypothetical protein